MKKSRYWSPYAAGIALGLVLLSTFYIAGRGLGASGAFSVTAAVGLHAVAPAYAEGLKYFGQYFASASPLLNWNFFLIVGVFLGSLAGALFSRDFRVIFDKAQSMSPGMRLLSAFVGGMLIGFAARLSRGCTSGVALTGGAQLALSGWTFVIAMFASGFIVAALFRRLWS